MKSTRSRAPAPTSTKFNWKLKSTDWEFFLERKKAFHSNMRSISGSGVLHCGSVQAATFKLLQHMSFLQSTYLMWAFLFIIITGVVREYRTQNNGAVFIYPAGLNIIMLCIISFYMPLLLLQFHTQVLSQTLPFKKHRKTRWVRVHARHPTIYLIQGIYARKILIPYSYKKPCSKQQWVSSVEPGAFSFFRPCIM